jgi:hypothetical protein
MGFTRQVENRGRSSGNPPPFLEFWRDIYAASRSFCVGVMPPCPSSNDLRPICVLCNGVSGPSAVKVKLWTCPGFVPLL